MSCPVGWPSAMAEVLWEVYGGRIMRIVKYITLFVLAAGNLVLWKLL